MPGNPTTIMTKIRQRSANNLPVNNERCHVLHPTVNWDGSIGCFEVFRNNAKGYHGQSEAGYLSWFLSSIPRKRN
jgi:hypothetical protein